MNVCGWLALGCALHGVLARTMVYVTSEGSLSRLLELSRQKMPPDQAERLRQTVDEVDGTIRLIALASLVAAALLFPYALARELHSPLSDTTAASSPATSTPTASLTVKESSPTALVPGPAWGWTLVIGLALSWLFGVFVPYMISFWHGERLLLATWPYWRLWHLLLAPLTQWQVSARNSLATQPAATHQDEAEEDLEEEIRSIVNAGQREGLIENDEREMIESVMELNQVTVAQIMTPRIDMVSMAADLGWDAVLRFASEHGHTRLPVHGKSRDEIVGILHLKDVLGELARPQQARRSLRALLRRPFFVPETKPVNEMLQEFQRGRTHLAIVLDEYGGVSGLVTIEDVLEEIVGEIADEHDDALVDGIKQLDDTTFEALARVRLEDLNSRLQLDLPEDESFETIGGYVFHELGRIPAVGEILEKPNMRIKVLDGNRRRLDRLLIELIKPDESAPVPQATASKDPPSEKIAE
ncbi:MAG: hemolysin family protein [Pirellulales bacterium]|nr:hemolysin family protein [Pirellulales bacterium]